MKTKSFYVGVALSACLLLGSSLAQAGVPVCSPTHGAVLAAGSSVVLTANCNPGADGFIQADGYEWQTAAPSAPGAGVFSAISGTSATITPTLPISGQQYRVRATSNIGTSSYSAAMLIYPGSPFCSLTSVSPAGESVEVAAGGSAILMPTCDAATSIDWYADKPAVGTLIPTPVGGIVTPATTTHYYVVGNNAYGSAGSNQVAVTVGSAAPAAPLCSLTASPLSIDLGGSTTLIATCPGATSFNWTGSGVASAPTSSGNVTATPATSGNKNYTVTGSNAGGTSAHARVDVAVSAAPVAVPSGCTVSPPNPASIIVGNNTAVTFTASCTSGTTGSTAYAWKVDGSSVSGSGSNYTTAANLPLGQHPVTFTASNPGGVSSAAALAATLAVISETVAVPSGCTVSPPNPASITEGNSTAVAFTASCTSGTTGSTAYAWKVDGSPVGGSASTYTTAANLSVGSHPVTFTASNPGGAPSVAASAATLTVNPVSSGGSTVCGTSANSLRPSASLSPVILANTNIVMRAASTGLNNNWRVNQGQSRSLEFKTGAAGTNAIFSFAADSGSTGVTFAPLFLNLSETQCDFSYSQIDSSATAGFNSKPCASGTFVVQTAGSTPIPGKCSLLPNKTYYLNIRNEMAASAAVAKGGTSSRGIDSCASTCGFNLVLYGTVQ